MSFGAEQIDHVEVLVSDIGAAARWYEEVLGLKELARWNPEPLMIGAGGTKLALFRRDRTIAPAPSGGEAPWGWRRVAWRTDKAGFRAAQEHLAKLGIAFQGPKDHGLSHSVYFADPDGNPLEITHYL